MPMFRNTRRHYPRTGATQPLGSLPPQQRIAGLEAAVRAASPGVVTILSGSTYLVGGSGAATRPVKPGEASKMDNDISGMQLLYLRAADFDAQDGGVSQLRIFASLAVNNTTNPGTFTLGLHSVSGLAGTSATIGVAAAAVADSAFNFNAPAAQSLQASASRWFAMPSDGAYIVGITNTQTTVVGARLTFSVRVQQRYV